MTPPGSADALLVRGVVLPEGEHRELYLVDGRISYSPVGDARLVADGWIVPGLIDAHCHVGLDAQGGVEDRAEQERQALADRDGGALLLRDCGVPVDTRWIDDREDLRASRAPAGTWPARSATSAASAARWSRISWSRPSPRRPGGATAG